MKRLVLLTIISIFNFQYSIAQKPIIPDTASAGQLRVDEVMRLIDGNYTESPDMDRMGEEAIKAMLKALDPHSVYIPAKDVQRANEGLQGNFEGVGVSFQIVNDTIVVQSVIDGGPSEKVGIMIGDKFIRIDGMSSMSCARAPSTLSISCATRYLSIASTPTSWPTTPWATYALSVLHVPRSTNSARHSKPSVSKA